MPGIDNRKKEARLGRTDTDLTKSCQSSEEQWNITYRAQEAGFQYSVLSSWLVIAQEEHSFI